MAVTKRIVLSFTARIFNLLGFLAPFVIRFKILLQKMWSEKFSWDDVVSNESKVEFEDLKRTLQCLSSFSVQRPYSEESNVTNLELIVFCDASTLAYCATVYLKSTSQNGKLSFYLVAAKTKVAPNAKSEKNVKDEEDLTIHRLELTAALLLSELVKRVAKRLNLSPAGVRAYSDSQVTLCWLAKPPESWKTFVRNRVSKVQPRENPSNLGTRGLSASELARSELWLNGPQFLRESFESESNAAFDPNTSDRKLASVAYSRLLSVCANVAATAAKLDFDVSFFARLLNIVSRILRWRVAERAKLEKEISPAELRNAFFALVKWSQVSSFCVEIDLLMKGEILPKSSRIIKFSPLLDSGGILRVGGRLANSDLPDGRKFPILISAGSSFAQLYVRYLHEKYYHAGAGFLMGFLSNQFYIVGGGRQLAKRVVYKCVMCARFNKKPMSQQMGQLPADRVRLQSPFSSVMVDFTGPFTTKCVGHRSTAYFKSYLTIFVCMAIRAVHFEVTSSLETESFLAAFHRFAARRGYPTKMYSDNGGNFQKARTILKIDWKFRPPYGSHHQGLVESAVKAAKRSLFKVTKGRVLTFEELNTLFSQIEAALNSRPLCRSGDGFLTPGHFLVGRHLLLPDDFVGQEVALEQRKHLTDQLLRDFWKSWYTDYLHELNVRMKWRNPADNLAPGDVVLAVLPNMKPTFWPLGKILEVFPGADGLVRRAKVRIGERDFERPVTKNIRLPIENPGAPEILPGTVSVCELPKECNQVVKVKMSRSLNEWSEWRSVFH